MKSALRMVIGILSRPRLVEFDYADTLGLHHGRCYVRCFFGNKQQAIRMMRCCGYTNIHIA